ncbi:hypothetical protein Tco_0966857 [Tanacetum coccineum]
MTSPVIELVSRPDSPNFHLPLSTIATATTTTIMTTLPLPPQPQQGSSDSIVLNRLGELEQHITDLVEANQALEERLDKHGSRLYKLENQDIPNQVSKAVDEIVTDAVDWAMQAPLRECFKDLPKANIKEILHNRMWESKSYQTHEDHMMMYEALEKSMARDNRDQLLSDLAEARKKKKKRQGSPKTPPGSPLHPPPAGPSGTSGAFGASAASAEYSAWTTTDTRIKQSVSPILAELHMYDDMTAYEQAYSSSGEDVGRPAYEIVKVFHPNVVHLQFQMEECHKLFTDQVDDLILRCGLKKNESMTSLQCMAYLTGGFKDNGSTLIDTHLKKLVIQQRSKLQAGIESYQTQLNLTKPRWDAKGFEYTHDFTVIDSPRAVTFRDKYGVQMIMSQGIQGQQDESGLDTLFGHRTTVPTEARSLCLPYRNALRQDVSSGIWKALLVEG